MDAVGVLIVALILRVPLAPALAALVFIGAFIPLVGAFVSGFLAVLVALVAVGWVQALIMLGGIVAVMQLEGHILQPFLLGRAVKLHPLAVLLGIAIGVVVGGIVGALLSIRCWPSRRPSSRSCVVCRPTTPWSSPKKQRAPGETRRALPVEPNSEDRTQTAEPCLYFAYETSQSL